MDFVVQTLQHIPSWLVYVLVAAFLLLESSGIPLLNTTVLLCTGALAALGRLDLGVLISVATLGSLLGSATAYGLGRRYGEPLLLRLTGILRLDMHKVHLAEQWFVRAGARMVFISRIVPYIRPFACFPAGISKMPFSRFLLASLLGSTVWCTSVLIIGWELGPRWKLALHLMRFYTLPTLGIVFALLVVSLVCKRLLQRRIRQYLEMQNEDA
ncbi:MAG: DedA family protein [Ktedonobacteraceae bacterium]